MDKPRISQGPQHEPGHIPSLDGWRGLSVLMVLLSHAHHTSGFPVAWKRTLEWLTDGNLAVRMFFVISGFLITRLLLAEKARYGAIDLRRFYYRRALRILPAHTLYLLVIAGLQCVSAYRQSAVSWLANVLFATNIITPPWPTAHFWSLAVEEQFYFTWPFLLALSLRRARQPLGLATKMLVIILLLGPPLHALSYALDEGKCPSFVPALAAVSPRLPVLVRALAALASFESIAAGCLLAVYWDRIRAWVIALGPNRGLALGLLCIAVVYIPAHAVRFEFLTVPLGHWVQAIGLGTLLACSVQFPLRGSFKWLQHPAVVWLGRISFSLYIWQQLFSSDPAEFGWKSPWLMTFPMATLSSLIAATISYYWVEQPFRRLRSRFRPVAAPQPVA